MMNLNHIISASVLTIFCCSISQPPETRYQAAKGTQLYHQLEEKVQGRTRGRFCYAYRRSA